MPKCLVCIRVFRDRQALHQHLQSSGDMHPVCIPCNRRFISEQAKDEHVVARHPPTYICNPCGRSYKAQFALEDHYRGSIAHPNCVKCGRGFKDFQERDEHHEKEHPQVKCSTCGGTAIYEDALAEHYKNSQKHPTCQICQHSFKDDTELNTHNTDPEAHPECASCKVVLKDNQDLEAHVNDRHIYCAPCGDLLICEDSLISHYQQSPKHPKCPECDVGCKDPVELDHHYLVSAHPRPKRAKSRNPVSGDQVRLEDERHDVSTSASTASIATLPGRNGDAAVPVAPPRAPSRGPKMVTRHAAASSPTPFDLRIADSLVNEFGAVRLGTGSGRAGEPRERMSLDSQVIRERWRSTPNINSPCSVGEASESLARPYKAFDRRNMLRQSRPPLVWQHGRYVWDTAGLGDSGPLGRVGGA